MISEGNKVPEQVKSSKIWKKIISIDGSLLFKKKFLKSLANIMWHDYFISSLVTNKDAFKGLLLQAALGRKKKKVVWLSSTARP